jgi:uncharacterized protein (TIGR02266 family)
MIEAVFKDRRNLRQRYLNSAPYGGLMVSAAKPLRVNDVVDLRVSLRREDICETLRGVVLWCRAETRQSVLAGVGFLEREAAKRERLLHEPRPAEGTVVDRQAERFDLALKVVYRTSMDFVVDFTRNLSLGGMFVKTSRWLPVGGRILFRICPPGEKPVELTGKVTRHAFGEGVGVRFVDDGPEVRERLERLVRNTPIDAAQASGPPVMEEMALEPELVPTS